MTGVPALEGFYSALLDDDAEELYNRAPCGYLSTTPDGLIIKANQTFLDLTGYTREELVQRRAFVELLNAGGRIYHETHYAPMLRMQRMVREIALDLVRADGSRLPVLINSVLDVHSDGTPAVVRIAVFDATERREYERELLRAKRRAEESEAHATQLARTLQQTLIPPTPPEIPGLEVSTAYQPAGRGAEIGGDFFDVIQLGPKQWAATIGDVCGKGPEAAVVTALVRYTMRAAAVRLTAPSEALAVVNDILLRHDTDRFCTAVLMTLERDDQGWTACISSGGHPPPLLLRDGVNVLADTHADAALGLIDGATYHDTEVRLVPGDAVLMFTDGVPEGRRGKDFYGDDRLLSVATAHTDAAASMVQAVLRDLMSFQDDLPRDDIALVGLKLPD